MAYLVKDWFLGLEDWVRIQMAYLVKDWLKTIGSWDKGLGQRIQMAYLVKD